MANKVPYHHSAQPPQNAFQRVGSAIGSGVSHVENAVKNGISGTEGEISREWYGSDGHSGPGGHLRDAWTALKNLPSQIQKLP